MKKFLSIGLVLSLVFFGLTLVNNANAIACTPSSLSITIIPDNPHEYDGNDVSVSAVADPSGPSEFFLDGTSIGFNGGSQSAYLNKQKNIGTYVYTLSNTAGYGYCAGSITATLVISDTTAPVLTLPADITTSTTNASGTAVAYTATATDAVDGAITPVCTPVSGLIFPVGEITVSCSATDASNNTANGTFKVTVNLQSSGSGGGGGGGGFIQPPVVPGSVGGNENDNPGNEPPFIPPVTPSASAGGGNEGDNGGGGNNGQITPPTETQGEGGTQPTATEGTGDNSNQTAAAAETGFSIPIWLWILIVIAILLFILWMVRQRSDNQQ